MNELYAILLGLVQGVSEWLPICTKTQILFASTLLFSLPLAVAYAFGLFHGDRFNRLRTSLFPERHPLPLQRSKTTRLTDRRNNSYRPRRRPIVLFDGQGSHNQPIQHRNTNGPAWTSADRDRILH